MLNHKYYSVPIHCDFLTVLAQGILENLIKFPEFSLTDYTLFLPTQRSTRILKDIFLKLSPDSAILLPRMFTINMLEQSEELDFYPGSPLLQSLDIPPVISYHKRILALSRLVDKFYSKIHGKTLYFSFTLKITQTLIRLLDEFQEENLFLEALENLQPEELSFHWEKNIDFLKILFKAWPAYLAEQELSDPVFHKIESLKEKLQQWEQSPPKTPYIVAGFIGTTYTSRLLLEGMQKLPRGMIFLWGLDHGLTDDIWEKGVGKQPSHYQFGFYKILHHLGLKRCNFHLWDSRTIAKSTDIGHFSPAQQENYEAFLQQIFYPCVYAFSWKTNVHNKSFDCFDHLHLLESENIHQEAQCIALILRHTLEEKGKTAVLVTPNHELSKRVVHNLHQWNIDINLSSGIPLVKTPLFSFLYDFVFCLTQFSIIHLFSFFKSPFFVFGQPAGTIKFHVRSFEKYIRQKSLLLNSWGSFETFLHENPDKEFTKYFLHPFFKILQPLLDTQISLSFRERLCLYHQTLEVFACDEQEKLYLYNSDIGEIYQQALSELCLLEEIPPIPLVETPHILYILCEEYIIREVRDSYKLHPCLNILGIFEARLFSADVVILGGLNETSWPQMFDVGQWFNRSMRIKAGLPDPEQFIGQHAYDFYSHLFHGEVYMTRSKKANGTQMTESRWISQLKACLHSLPSQAMESIYQKGRMYSQWNHKFCNTALNIKKNCPQEDSSPGVSKQLLPQELSPSSIRILLKNPYQFYARYILHLKPLKPLENTTSSASTYGLILHSLLENLLPVLRIQDNKAPLISQDIFIQKFLAQVKRLLYSQHPEDYCMYVLWEKNFSNLAEKFYTEEKDNFHIKSITETKGRYPYTLEDGSSVTFSARMDRVDYGSNILQVMDYKTGEKPKKINILKTDPQLYIQGYVLQGVSLTDHPLSYNDITQLTYMYFDGSNIDLEKIPPDWEEFFKFLEEKILSYYETDNPSFTKAFIQKSHKNQWMEEQLYYHLSRREENFLN